MPHRLKRIVFVILTLALLCPPALVAANFFSPLDPAFGSTRVYERRAFLGASFPFIVPYMLFTPYDYDPAREYPLVMILHGAKKRALDAETLPATLIQDRYPSFVLMPLAPFRRVDAIPG